MSFFFVSSRITSKSSMHVAFTLMRGNLKCPCHQFVLFFHSKGHTKKITSAKKFFDLNKTRFFYEFLKTESLKRFRIALKRKMTIENTRQQGIEVSYFYYKIY